MTKKCTKCGGTLTASDYGPSHGPQWQTYDRSFDKGRSEPIPAEVNPRDFLGDVWGADQLPKMTRTRDEHDSKFNYMTLQKEIYGLLHDADLSPAKEKKLLQAVANLMNTPSNCKTFAKFAKAALEIWGEWRDADEETWEEGEARYVHDVFSLEKEIVP